MSNSPVSVGEQPRGRQRQTRRALAFLLAAAIASLAGGARPENGRAADPQALRAVAYWPLDEGTGKVVHSAVGEHRGTLTASKGGTIPTWQQTNGRAELLFPGGAAAGYVAVPHGGELLHGPFFEIALEFELADATSRGNFLTTKAGSEETGGFNLTYMPGGRTLHFACSDGTSKLDFRFRPKNVRPKTWQRLLLRYDGVDLALSIDGVVAGRHHIPGFHLAANRQRDLNIGAYAQGQAGFRGAMRNVRLSRGDPAAASPELIQLGARARVSLDGMLGDEAWRSTSFRSLTPDPRSGRLPDTRFAVAADREKLYVAIRSPEPAGADRFDVVVDPDASGDHFFRFTLGADGSRSESLFTHLGGVERTPFAADWEAAVGGGPGFSAELAIPFESVLAPLDGDGVWHFDLVRRRESPDAPAARAAWGVRSDAWEAAKREPFASFRYVAGVPTPGLDARTRRARAANRSRYQMDEVASGSTPSLATARDFMFVANNLIVPNLMVTETAGRDTLALKTTFVLDVPDGVELLAAGRPGGLVKRHNTPEYRIETDRVLQREGKPYRRYRVTPTRMKEWIREAGPFYFSSQRPDGANDTLYFRSMWDGGAQPWQTLSLVTRTFPTPGMPRRVVAPLAWMDLISSAGWPRFLDSYPALGFNYLPASSTDTAAGMEEFVLPQLSKARDQGLRVTWVDSEYTRLRIRDGGSLDPATGKPYAYSKHDLCPAYRGPDYWKAVDLMVDRVRRTRAEILNLDIEAFGRGPQLGLSGQCQRCTAYFEKSGMKPERAMVALGTEIMSDLRRRLDAMAAEEKRAPTRFGTYHTQPGGFVYTSLFDYDQLEEVGVDIASPVFYGSDTRRQGRELRRLRSLLESGRLIPWMNPGGSKHLLVSGKNPVTFIYDRVLECYGSGCSGIYWFSLRHFKGADFFYYAKAMDAVVRVEDIVLDGAPTAVASSTSAVAASGLRLGDEHLLLLSRYDEPAYARPITLTLPHGLTGAVWDVSRGVPAGTIRGREVILDRFEPGVEGAHTALYYVGARDLGASAKATAQVSRR